MSKLRTIIIAVFLIAATFFAAGFTFSQRQAVDTLILGGTVVTMNSDMAVIEDGAVAVRDGIIIAVGKSDLIKSKFRAGITIDTAGKIVMPGLVNTHTHAAMVLFRGYADDLPLLQWLKEYIWPAEAEFINRESVRIASRLAIAEMICSGTTTFNDMYFFEDDLACVAKEAGIRAVIGEGILDYPTPNSKTPEAGLEYTEQLIKKYAGDRLITVAVAAHSIQVTSEALELLAARKTRNY